MENTNLPGNKSLDELYRANRALNNNPTNVDNLFKPINIDTPKETITPSFGDPVEDYWKAENQGLEMIPKAVSNTVTEAFFGALEGAGYLADLPGIWNSVTQSEQEFGNWFSDYMKQAKEATRFDIYKTDDAEGFAPWDATWWASNAPSIGSAVSLLIPATLATKGLSMIGKAANVGKILNTTTKINVAKGLTAATTSRIMENTMEASGIYDEVYQKSLSEGMVEFKAKQKAAEAAQQTWNANSALLLTDAFQYGKMLRGFKASRAFNTENVLANAVTEAGEEGYQFIAGEEAKRKPDNTSFSDRLKDYLSDGQFWTSAAFGAMGGSVFAMAQNKLDKAAIQSTEQARAAVMGDKKKFYDMQDDAFMDLASDHVINGTAGRLESDLKSLAESNDEQVAELEANPDNYRTKVKKRLEDLAFAEDTYNEIALDPNKSKSVIGKVELAARIQQRLKENRLKDLNTEINTGMSNARVSLSLTPELQVLKEQRLHSLALEGNTVLQGLKKDYDDKFSEGVKALGLSKQDVLNKLKFSGDNVLVQNLKDKYSLETDLNQIKDIVAKTETKKGQEELKKDIQESGDAKTLRAFQQHINKPEFAENPEQLELLKEEPGLLASTLAPKMLDMISKKQKEIKDKQEAEKKAEEFSVVEESKTNPEVIETVVKERLEKPNVDETVELQDDQDFDVVKGEVKNDIKVTEEQLELEDANDQLEVIEETNTNFEKQVVEETTKINSQFQVMYFDGNKPEMLWISKPDSLPTGTELEFEYTEDEQGLTAGVVNKIKNLSDVEGKKITNFATANKYLIYPIKITSEGKLVGYVPALYSENDVKVKAKIARFRKALSEGKKFKAKVSHKGPGSFNTVKGKNAGPIKEEKLADTLQSNTFYIGLGIGGNIQVPNNLEYNQAVTGPNSTTGALYVIVQAADGTLKPARTFNRSLNDSEIDYVYNRIKQYDGNIQSLKEDINEVTYIGSNSGKNNPQSYLRVSKNFVEFYDSNLGANVRYSYEELSEQSFKNFLKTKFRNVVASKLNIEEPYTNKVNGRTYSNYNEFLSDDFVITSNLVAGAPFRQSAVYFDGFEEIQQNDIEAKKADIERRRQEELQVDGRLEKTSGIIQSPSGKFGIAKDKERKWFDTLEETQSIINAKYDAELKALEQPIEEVKKPVNKRQVGSKINPLRRGLIETFDKDFKVWDRTKELAWLKNNIPGVNAEVLDDLTEVYSKAGQDAYGLFYNSMIYVMNNAPEGITYHEAFHAVFNLFLSEGQKTSVMKEAKSKYGKPVLTKLKEQYPEADKSELEDLFYEEKLAEDFRRYVLDNNRDKSFTGKIADFFKRLYQMFKTITQNKNLTIDELFYRTNSGIYKRTEKFFKRNINQFENPKFYLHPNFNIKGQQEAIESINFIFFEELEEVASKISNDMGRPVSYDEVLSDLKLPLDTIYNRVLTSLEDKGLDLIVDSFDTKDINGIEIEGLKEKHKKYLSNYGYNVKTRNLNIAEEREDFEKVFAVNEEQLQRESWQYSYLEVSGRDKLSSRMKRFIGLTRKATKEYNEEGDYYVPEYNMFGEFKLVNLNETYAYLVRNLSGINTFSEMLDRLLDLVDYNPSLYEIYQTLEASDKDFQSEFFTNFSKADHKFITVLFEDVYNDDQEFESRNYKLLDSNRRTLNKTIFSEWESKFKSKFISYVKNKEVINKDKVENVKTKFDNLKTKIKETPVVTDALINSLVDVLDDLGIVVEKDVFVKFKKDFNAGNIVIKGINKFSNLIFGDNTASLETLINKLNKGINIFEDEKTSINAFVNLVVNTQLDFIESNFKNVENKSVYSYNNNSFITKFFNDLKGSNSKQIVKEYLKMPFNSSSIWLNKLLNNESFKREFDIYTLDGLRENKKEGVKFADMTSKESLIAKMNMFFNKGYKYGYYAMATPADNPLLRFIKADKIDPKQAVEEILKTIVYPEFDRIRKASEDVDRVIAMKEANDPNWKIEENKIFKNYHFKNEKNKLAKDGNAFKLQYLPIESLNQYTKTVPSLSEKEIIRKEVKAWLKAEVNTLKNDLYKKGIIDVVKDINGKQQVINKLLDDNGINSYSVGQNENIVEVAIEAYYYNSLIAGVEMTRIGIGDLAFYKKDGNNDTTTVDASKRTPEINAPGEDPNTEIKDKFTLAVLRTEKIDTPLYEGVDETDAQGYCTLDRYIDLLKMTGRFDYKTEAALEDLRNGNPTNDSLSILLNPLKPFYFGHEHSSFGVNPMQVKYSSVPLIPALTKNHPRLDALRKAMESKGIDELVFDSAVKVGQRVSLSYDDFVSDRELDQTESYILENKNWRRQQNIPEHHLDSENIYGSQIRRLIIANLNDEHNYDLNGASFTGKELKRIYHEAISQNVKKSLKDVLKEFKDVNAVRNMLLREVESRNLGDQYVKALDLINGELVIPPTMTKKFESILLSVFKNNVMRPKIKGMTAVQVSKFGFEDLKMFTNEDGKVTDAECLLPWWSKEFFPVNENGEVDIENADPEILKLVGYRIPTEGKYSMIPLKVKGFLPKESGSIVVLPSEITAQMGSDFDIDKLYIMMPEFDSEGNKIKPFGSFDNIKNNTTEQNNNLLLDITRAILLDPSHFNEMKKPGGFETLKELASNVLKLEGKSSEVRSYVSPNVQEYLRDINQAGSQLIGLGANHNTNHPLAVESGWVLENTEGVKFNGVAEIRLDREKNIEDKLISEDLAEFLAAFVDNAKDPLASYLNITMSTFGVAALIVRTGFGLKTASYFLSQPILKEYITEAAITDNNTALKKIVDKYSKLLTTSTYKFQKEVSFNFTTEELEDMIKNKNFKNQAYIVRQLQLLSTFTDYSKLAGNLQKAVSATRADALGLNPTLTGNRRYLDNVRESIGSRVLSTLDVFRQNSTYPLVKAFTDVIPVANDKVGKYIPWDKPAMIKARAQILLNTPESSITEKIEEDINYAAMTYLMSDLPFIQDNFNRRNELFYGNDSLANRLINIKEKYSDLKDNHFLRLLQTPNIDKQDEIKTIKFLAPTDKSSTERDMIIADWYDLLISDNEEIQNLGKDLVLYSLFTTGLVKNLDSYFDYIPLDYLDEIGYRIHYKDKTELLNQEDYLNGFVDQFFRNNSSEGFIFNFKGKTIAENIDYMVIDTTEEGLDIDTRIIKRNNKIYAVQDIHEGGALYGRIGKLGNDNIMEYSFGENINTSIIPSNNVIVNPKNILLLSDFFDGLNLEKSEESGIIATSLEDKINNISDEEAEQRKKDCE